MRRPNRNLDERVNDGEAIDAALRRGVRAALIRHQRLGQSIAVWRDGKVVVVPPEKIAEELDGGSGPPQPSL
jgi:hypothetical protein